MVQRLKAPDVSVSCTPGERCPAGLAGNECLDDPFFAIVAVSATQHPVQENVALIRACMRGAYGRMKRGRQFNIPYLVIRIPVVYIQEFSAQPVNEIGLEVCTTDNIALKFSAQPVSLFVFIRKGDCRQSGIGRREVSLDIFGNDAQCVIRKCIVAVHQHEVGGGCLRLCEIDRRIAPIVRPLPVPDRKPAVPLPVSDKIGCPVRRTVIDHDPFEIRGVLTLQAVPDPVQGVSSVVGGRYDGQRHYCVAVFRQFVAIGFTVHNSVIFAPGEQTFGVGGINICRRGSIDNDFVRERV